MLIGVAGIPQPHFNRFQQQAGKLFGAGHTVIGVPSKSVNGAYITAAESADSLISRIAEAVLAKPAIATQGLAVLYVAHDWTDPKPFEQRFSFSALTKRVSLPHPVLEHGDEGRGAANQLMAALSRAAPPLIRAVKAMTTELAARKNRTPLLLPVRNFSSLSLSASVQRLSEEIIQAKNPHERLMQACIEIEAEHPFGGFNGKKGFADRQAIVFRSPGRDLHGKVWETHGTHTVQCTLNSMFRLGGPIAAGFHFDCERAPRVEGRFPNCHDEIEAYVGKPHLNIAPNDFIRI